MPAGKKCIYIVDDDISICRSLRLLLGSFGFEARIYGSAEEFLASVRQNATGCLVLDVHMPGMDGFALQTKLKACGYRLPIIFISANRNLKFSRQYLKETGAIGFLQKPFTGQTLIDLITGKPVNAGKKQRNIRRVTKFKLKEGK